MIYIYVENNIAVNFIEESDPVFPNIPIEERYAPEFLAKCVQAEEGAEICAGYIFDPETKRFSPPPKEGVNAEEFT